MKKPINSEQVSIDDSVNYLLNNQNQLSIETVWDRSKQQKTRCGFGEQGLCCHNCYMGPCRISPTGKGAQKGVCGAPAEVIVARNFARMVAGGASAHSDHGREVAKTLLLAAQHPDSDHSIKDTNKLKKVASTLGLSIQDRAKEDIAKEVAEILLAEFGQQEGELSFTKLAPVKRQELWRQLGVIPRGIDREIVEMLHRTSVGVDQEHQNIFLQACRTALADGWGGSMIATELQDILYGTPSPIRGEVNLGVLSESEVNIAVHGHEPAFSEMLVIASQDKELIDLAKKHGAAGINLVGICCVANEILLRHGLPVAGNVLQQELAIATGAVETMLVDVQCIMSSLPDVSQHYHTKVITTSPKAKIKGAEFLDISENNSLETAKKIIRDAILNFSHRNSVDIPKQKMDLVAGFSHEAINYMLGGRFRGSYTPLNDNIINGRIRGVAAVVGCCNPKIVHDQGHVSLVEELIANDILVVQTGCSATACAKAGFLTPESATKYAGSGLAEVCRAVGMPPVLHSGSCVDNSRLLIALSEMVKVGGLGDDISDLPVAGAAPEWMSEKAISIGQYFVASGVYVVFGIGMPVTGSSVFSHHIFEECEKILGGKWDVEEDTSQMAAKIIDHINHKREKLGISKGRKRVLYDMAMRRELKI